VILSQGIVDFLFALGGFIGLTTKLYALWDTQTVWSRRSSGLNVISYPFTALLPIWALGLPLSFLTSVLNLLVWIGIYLFRAPDEEDLLGRKNS